MISILVLYVVSFSVILSIVMLISKLKLKKPAPRDIARLALVTC